MLRSARSSVREVCCLPRSTFYKSGYLASRGRSFSSICTHEQLDAIVKSFPAVDFAMAYGSAVFPQKSAGNSSTDETMVDMIFGVSDPDEWHQMNMEMYPRHYSLIARACGPGCVVSVQRTAANIYYNTLIDFGNRTKLKYGVISAHDLRRDLTEWTTMYVSGRMHKPVHILEETELIRTLSKANLRSAMRAALLILPDTFSEFDLFCCISRLSYSGDVRMGLAENPNKVENIVSRSLPLFRNLYDASIRELELLGHLDASSGSDVSSFPDRTDSAAGDPDIPRRYSTNLDSKQIAALSVMLPVRLRRLMFEKCWLAAGNSRPVPGKIEQDADCWESLSINQQSASQSLQASIRSIVGVSSLWQSGKGLFSAGPYKSCKYALRKASKAYFGQ